MRKIMRILILKNTHQHSPPKHRVVAAEDAALAHTEPQSHNFTIIPAVTLNQLSLKKIQWPMRPSLFLSFNFNEPPRRTYISSPVSPSCMTSSSRQYTFCLRFWYKLSWKTMPTTSHHLHPFRNVPLWWQFLLPRNTIRPPGFRSDLNQGLLVPLLWLILVEGPLYLQWSLVKKAYKTRNKVPGSSKPSLCTYNFKLAKNSTTT